MTYGLLVPTPKGLKNASDLRTLKEGLKLDVTVPNGYSNVPTVGTPGWAQFQQSQSDKTFDIAMPSGMTRQNVSVRFLATMEGSGTYLPQMWFEDDQTFRLFISNTSAKRYHKSISLTFMRF